MSAIRSPSADLTEQSEDPSAATLSLPTGLAYAIAAFSVAAALALLSAIATSGSSWVDALANHDLHNVDLAAVLGALILRRTPGHVIGWLLVAVGAFESVAVLSRAYRYFGLPDGSAIENHLAGLWVPGAACLVIALPQLFPDGRLLSRRWLPLALFGAAAAAALFIVFLLDSSGTGPSAWGAAAFPLFGVAALASLLPLALRFRRSRGARRQQFKWVFYGLAISLPLLALGTATIVAGESTANSILTLIALDIIPLSITVAVLRYRLFDVDIVISRTLLVAGLAGFITVAYVAIVVGVGSLFGQGAEPDLVLSVVATAVVAVAFQPVRRGLQRVANRLVFGRRATPYDVLSGFATRVGAAEPSSETLVQLAELMAGGTGADPARVWLRVRSELRPAATWPPAPHPHGAPASVPITEAEHEASYPALAEADLAVPVRDGGELLGVLTIAKPRGERLTEIDSELLQRLAAASGVLLRNLRLDAELAQRLADLEASRRRLLSAQNDARQRIEEDLAGGTRAQLVALGERLSALSREVDSVAAPKTAMLLEQLVSATAGAISTLDGLAAGVYPPRLASDGLPAALREQSAKAALAISVQAEGVGRYSAEVEAAVYFSILEALQNVAKYAKVESARVLLTQQEGLLSFEVADEGAGFDAETTRKGTGLLGMADRLDTVGATLTVDSAPGRGTTITGRVPALPADAPPLPRSAEPALAGASV